MSDKTPLFSISARNLGEILLALFCPACFWYKLRLRFSQPFKHGGGAIFSDMQKMQEAIITYYLDRDGCLPKEFAPFCDCASRIDFPRNWSKYSYTHKSGVGLHGIPDDILQLEDGSICVIDYKTAHNRGEDDPFLPQYRCQVIGYAKIAEELNLGTVTKAGLLYWEAQHQAVVDDPSAFYSKGALRPPFTPKPLEFEVDYSILDDPIKEAMKLWKASVAPEGREGCKECKKLALLFAIENEVLNKEQLIISRFGNAPDVRRSIEQRMYDRRCEWRSALAGLDDFIPDTDLLQPSSTSPEYQPDWK